MTAQTIKLELIEWLKNTNDQELLEILYSVKISSVNKDWWTELTPSQKTSIEKGAADCEQAKILTSSEFWQKHEMKI